MDPVSFNWAKDIFTLRILPFLSNSFPEVSFNIEATCPSTSTVLCDFDSLNNDEDSFENLMIVELSIVKNRKHLVDSELRRSPRLTEKFKGFKSPGCDSKLCSTCTPPSLSVHRIRKLGSSFCNIDETDLSKMISDALEESRGSSGQGVQVNTSRDRSSSQGRRKGGMTRGKKPSV